MISTAYRVACPDCGITATFEPPFIDDESMDEQEQMYVLEEFKQEVRAMANRFLIGHKNRRFALGHRCNPQLHATSANRGPWQRQTQLGSPGS